MGQKSVEKPVSHANFDPAEPQDGSYEDSHVSISTAIEIQKTCREKPINKLNTEGLGMLVKPSRFGAKSGAMRCVVNLDICRRTISSVLGECPIWVITDLVYDIYREQSFALILVGKSMNGGYSLFLPNARKLETLAIHKGENRKKQHKNITKVRAPSVAVRYRQPALSSLRQQGAGSYRKGVVPPYR